MAGLKPYFYFISIALWFASCTTNTSHDFNKPAELEKSKALSYAERFSMGEINGYKTLYLFGNRNSNDTTATFVLYPRDGNKPSFSDNAFYIPTPVERVACLSSVYVTMLQKLGLLKNIVAIDNVDYYNNTQITEGVEQKKILELAKGPEINAEQTLLLKPDLILTFGMGNPAKDVNAKIISAGIPAAISLDHLEETPLARAEWIKFIAAFFNKDKEADSIFKQIESSYIQLTKLTDTLKTKPSVLTEMKYSDAWYVPGGNSYMANLLKDAGGNYLWKDEKRSGSIPLNFESVYTRAKDADYWINLFININSKKDLLAFEERYALFKPFKTGNIYNNNKVANAKGYSIYWEEGICNPDELLKDIICILHPEVLPQHQLKYYKKIE